MPQSLSAMPSALLRASDDVEGWTLRVFTLERTKEGERVTAPLDRLARAAMGDPELAALATTLDGGTVVLAVAARDPKRVERVAPGSAGQGTSPGLACEACQKPS